MASDDQKKDGKGFAGLSSMVSDVDSDISSSKTEASNASSDVKEQTPLDRPSAKEEGSSGSSGSYTQPPQPPSGGSSGKKWLIGLGIFFGFIWLISNSGSKNSSTPSSYSTPPATVPSAPSPSPSLPAQPPPPVPSRPTEVKPGVGTNNTLDVDQIRYCVAEKIRLDASENAVDRYSADDVDRFNSIVADFNSRCGQYRYRRGALERAQSDIEPYRSQLQVEGANRFAHKSESRAPKVVRKSKTLQPRPAPRVAAPAEENDSGSASIQLTGPERESIEAACSTDKYVNGPAAYRACLNRQMSALQKSVRRPDLGGLSTSERESIEAACSTDKYVNGPAAYNRCLTKQLAALNSQNRRPSLSGLASYERESIEAACSTDKYVNGPSAYNSCLSSQLQALKRQGGRPNLSGLSSSERQSIESACSTDKYVNGPAAYNSCLSQQLSRLRN